MIMTEFPIVDIITNKKYKNLNKSNNFKERQRKFKRQEKQAKQISELPNKFQKAIKAVNTSQEKKPKPKPNPKSNPKLMFHKQKKMPISARSVQNILDEEYEGQVDAVSLLTEIAIEENLLEYQAYLEEEIQHVVEEYEKLIKAAEKDYQFDYCEDLFDLSEDFCKDIYDRYYIGGSWSEDDEE
jgi:hypothetical protein